MIWRVSNTGTHLQVNPWQIFKRFFYLIADSVVYSKGTEPLRQS